ncbi:transcriptional repressor [Pseudogymnoascus australis]
MASNPLRIRNKSGRDIDILCGAATDEPVSPRNLPSPNVIRTTIPERRRVGVPLPPWEPQDLSLPLPPPLGDQRSSVPELRRLRTHWDLNSRDDGVADYAHDPFSAPDMRGPLSSSSLGASARDYYHHMGEDRRHSYHDGMMRPKHGRQTSPPTPGLFRCGSRDSINTVNPASPSTPRDALPEYGYPPSRNASFSSMGPVSMYPDPTQFEPGSRHFDGYAKPPQAPLPRFRGTLPAPHVPMHAHHYHEHHYHDPAMAAYARSQGHMVPQIPAFAPQPATAVTASGTKRYHCRYADAAGCEKTFTTSGHASRHSKIHTCEKGIQCAFAGCPKKFTRADNMKQHLETHFKDARRRRPSTSSNRSASNSRLALRKNAGSAAVVIRRGARGLTRDMVRLQPKQLQEVVRGDSQGA